MSNHLYDALVDPHRESEEILLRTVEKEPRTFTWDQMHRMAGRMARALQRLGARPGDRITVQVHKSPETLALYLACLRGGFVFQPLNPAYTTTELEHFVTDADPAVIICDPDRKADLEPLAARIGARLSTLRGDWKGSFFMLQMVQPETFETVERRPEDPAAILYTSGTTGRPKGAVLTHGNLLSNARDLVSVWDFTADDVLIHALPVYHAHGLFVACNVTMLAGASMIWLEKFDADAVVKAMPEASVLMGVPTFYARLLEHRGLKRATPDMRLFISGSAPLSPALHARFREKTGHAILERYGLTETGMNASNPLDGERRPGSVGPALPSTEIRITDPDGGTVLPTGETGMIEVRGPNVFPGYWKREKETEEAFRKDGWFVTGDLGHLDADGYLHISGRARDLIITGGLNVYPAEVEAVIDAVPGVAESAVIGLPDPEWGETVCAVIAPQPGRRLKEDDILATLENRLARFKLPCRIVFMEALPRNTMGKVMKDELRRLYGNG